MNNFKFLSKCLDTTNLTFYGWLFFYHAVLKILVRARLCLCFLPCLMEKPPRPKMKLIYVQALTLFLLCPFSLLFAQADKGLSIMQAYQEAISVNDLSSKVYYKNTSRKGRIQERRLSQFIKKRAAGENKYSLLLQFSAPLDIKGTGTLTWQHQDQEDDQWLFLPAIRNARRISPGRKTDRFMGTEITFEDLSGYLSEALEKYQYNYIGEKEREGQLCHVIEAIPTDAEEQKNSGYSKRVLWITKDKLITIYTSFFDKNGTLAKEYTAWDIKQVPNSSRYRPFSARMKNLLTGNATEIIYSEIKIDSGISEDIFTKQYLETL